MPDDDLLRHIIGPTPYSSVWSWLALGLAMSLILWYAGIFLFTAPGRGLREVPLVGEVRDRVIRHGFARAVREIGERHRAGELGSAQAGAAISRQLRRFLHQETGLPAEYMHLDAIARSEIAPAAVVLDQLIDVQFNAASQADVGKVGRDAEELIRSWG